MKKIGAPFITHLHSRFYAERFCQKNSRSGSKSCRLIHVDETQLVPGRQFVHQLVQCRHRLVRAHQEDPITQENQRNRHIADHQVARPQEEMAEKVESIPNIKHGFVQLFW